MAASTTPPSMLMLSVSGCRGVVGQSLTPSVASRFAACFASTLRGQSPVQRPLVVLGRDGRVGGEMIHAAAIAGLLGAGCDVQDLGVAMTPTVATLTDIASGEHPGRVVAGMVLTASHNPQQWNGLKCLLRVGGVPGEASAAAPPAHLAQALIASFKAGDEPVVAWSEVGRVTRRDDAAQTHVQRVLRALRESGLCPSPSTLCAGLRVAVDCVNASACAAAPMLLSALGVSEVRVLAGSSDGEMAGLFPHPPEPTRENLSTPGGLCDSVRETRCDVGFALDPDADRCALIDERGEYVGEEYTLALSALALFESGAAGNALGGPVTLATNLSTSRMLDDVAQRFGGSVLRTPVGEANVVEAMKKHACVAGGEGNGGLIWPRVCYVRDSLCAMALTLWLLSPQGGGRGARRTLSSLASSLPAYSIQKRKIDLRSTSEAAAFVAKAAQHFAGQQQHVDTRDGAWVNITKGPLAGKAWVHVRASNTEPILRLIAEAPTSFDADGLLDEAARALDA